MSTQPVTTPTSTGNCIFCQTEVAKSKMTQHLKFCKQRRATIAKQEETPTQPKTKLFHILAEGQYAPQYWLHFEMPASEPLWSLDAFLKDMWVDDLDHLSGFTINGTSYSVEDRSLDVLLGRALKVAKSLNTSMTTGPQPASP